MYKNQLQELAQRSCFNLPSYGCIREGPDHAPRFRAAVNFNGEIFEGPNYCTTLRQAEHAAAEVALTTLSTRGPPRSLAARVLDETGVYKNLLQETAHRAGLKLPLYTTIRTGPGHMPVFTSNVELAGMSFNGDPAKTKKQAEKNAAMAAWSSLKQFPNLCSLSQPNKETADVTEDNQEQVIVARALSTLKSKDENNISSNINNSNNNSKVARQKKQHQNLVRKRVISLVPSHDSSLHRKTNELLSSEVNTCMSEISSPSQSQLHNVLCTKTLTRYQQHEPPPSPKSTICSKEPTSGLPIPPSNRTLPVQIRTRTDTSQQHNEEKKQKDEVLQQNSQSRSEIQQLHMRARDFRPPTTVSAQSNPVVFPSRLFCNKEFTMHHHHHAMAPAVHMRSVIPVCAAPPPPPPMNPTNPQPPPPSSEKIQQQEPFRTLHKDEVSDANAKMVNLSLGEKACNPPLL